MMLRIQTFTFYCAILSTGLLDANALQMPNFFAGFKPPQFGGSGTQTNSLKSQVLDAVSFTNNGKDATVDIQKNVLRLIRQLETKFPVSDTLLTDAKESQALEGTWYLQYTSPCEIGEADSDAWTPENSSEGASKIDTKAYNNKGTIGAAGITVETANRVTKQIFDITAGRVTNDVEQDFGKVKVGGTFRKSETVPNRAVVAFDNCEIAFNNGIKLNLSFLFYGLGVFRGTMDNGWLETTYLDANMRIGRGNKGTLFVLTRDRDAVQP